MAELNRPIDMEVDDNTKSVMASSGTVGSVSISLHPLVIMNISEHWTRLRAQEGRAQQGLMREFHAVIMKSFMLCSLFFFSYRSSYW